MPDASSRGQTATRPQDIPAPGWKDIGLRVKDEITRDHVSVVSAGVAFFGLLAIFPAIGALISIAGFFLNPDDVAQQIDTVAALLPENAAAIIQDQIVKVTGGDDTATGFAAIFGLLLALYGAMKGMLTLMEGMNIAYDEQETRGFVALYLTGFVLTLFLIVGVLAAFGVVMILPAVTGFLGLPEASPTAIAWLQWPILAVLTMLGLAVALPLRPGARHPKWRWVSPGAVIATVLWLVGTLAFSIYAQNFGSYNETYGTMGGVIILLTWLWLSAFIVLAGAELNSEMEHQTAATPPPAPARAEGRARRGQGRYPARGAGRRGEAGRRAEGALGKRRLSPSAARDDAGRAARRGGRAGHTRALAGDPRALRVRGWGRAPAGSRR